MIVDHSFFLESDDTIPPAAFVPIVRSQCICPASFTADGVEWQPREPNCMHPKHGLDTRFVPQPAMKQPHRVRTASNVTEEQANETTSPIVGHPDSKPITDAA